MIRLLTSLLFLAAVVPALAQPFTRADSLRGALRPERTCYDVYFYDLEVKVDPEKQRISGRTDIHFTAMQNFTEIQVDLFANMFVDAITFEGKALDYRREFDAIFIEFPEEIRAPQQGMVRVAYSGNPQVAARPPWDGGFVWKKDSNGKPWVGVACEGTGASLWWPGKDYLGDEPDSMRISVIHPIGLKAVCNGNQRSVTDLDVNWTKTEWFVSYPINNYNVTLNIGDYLHWSDTYTNASGTHPLDYYVMPENEAKSREQFAQVKPMLEVFEKHFGEYPFWRDGYALVETAYLGMEHQGAIAYGNKYLPGYAGYDALDLGWDYIIIHESGHEWWGNSVSCKDHAELWIHEGFCTYSEAVYVEALFDKATAVRYLRSQRRSITNLSPIVGPLDVNFNNWSGSDMYYKGSWMLHTLRHQVNDDELWWKTLRNFAETFRLKNTDTQEVIAWWNEALGADYTWLWRQYLYHAAPPRLLYKLKKKGSKKTKLRFKWEAGESDFRLPLTVQSTSGEPVNIYPTTDWKKAKIAVPFDQFKFDYSTWYGKTRNVGKK
ncbi:MAG: M1 family metallopeptidase [Bacteroidota bacterium]